MINNLKNVITIIIGIIIGVLSWVVITRLFGVIEVYDTPVGSYIAMFVPTLIAFYIALTNSLVKALLFLVGVYIATIFYPYFFGSTEHKVWVGIGAVLAIVHLFYAFVGAFVGWIVRLLYLRFLNKYTKQATQKIMDKTIDLTKHIPKTAYETYTYTQKASRVGYYNLFFALVFATIGTVTYIYPSPPFKPIEIPFFQAAIQWFGVFFILIALYETILSIRLLSDKSAWYIVIDDKNFLYETPKSTHEKSFSCRLDEIEKINQFLTKPENDAEGGSSEPIYEVVLKDGQVYPLFSGRNRIDKYQLLDALRARGVQIVERYLT